jgi:predicted phosphodiesterase
MRFAVLSDIHANMEAFEAVLADIDSTGVSEIVCLGDTIGYGAEPEDAVRLLRARNIPSVLGNHEAGLVDPNGWFNPQVRSSMRLTKRLLSFDSLTFLRNLPRCRVRNGIRFVHGFPPDSVSTYLFEKSDEELRVEMGRMEERICFLGHTHELELVSLNGNEVIRRKLRQGLHVLPLNGAYLVNVGSVGQPRDQDLRAKYILFDPITGVLEVRCIAYDARSTAAKIIALGLPRSYASRLLP